MSRESRNNDLRLATRRDPKIMARVAKRLNEREQQLNSNPPLSDWALNQIAELGFNGADY